MPRRRRRAVSASAQRDRWPVIGAWALVTAVLGGVQLLALPQHGPIGRRSTADLVSGWVHYDGPEYLRIAVDGYQRRQLVWFPAYPLLIRALDTLGGPPAVMGVVVSATAGLVSVVVFREWLLTLDLSTTARRCALAALMLYPYGWFLYGVVYADSLFLAFTLSAFVLVERHRLVAAGLVAALATATRPSGTAVVIGLFLLALEREGVLSVEAPSSRLRSFLRLPSRLDRSRLRPKVFAPLLGFGGLIAYAAWQFAAWGSPLRFVTEEANYHDTGDATFLKRQYFEAWYGGFDGRHLATTTAQAVILVIVLLSVPAVGRRFGWGYGAYVFLLAAFPAFTVSTFMGVGRYLLPAFPCFALAGVALAERRVARTAWFAVSASSLVLMSYGFARGWYLT